MKKETFEGNPRKQFNELQFEMKRAFLDFLLQLAAEQEEEEEKDAR